MEVMVPPVFVCTILALLPLLAIGQLYCPDCHTNHEGLWDCHHDKHHDCHHDEICQIHAHEDPHHGFAVETGCRKADHCYDDAEHDFAACAQGTIYPGHHGCFWCCDSLDSACWNRYLHILFPSQYSTVAPVTTMAPTMAPTTAPVTTAITVEPTNAPVVDPNCHLCSMATHISQCLAHPYRCDLTSQVCMIEYNNGTLNSGCSTDTVCTARVQSRNSTTCYSNKFRYDDICTFCCEAPGCLEDAIKDLLPDELTAALPTTTSTAAPTIAPTATPSAAATTAPTAAVTTKAPLGPNGEINCHICHDTSHLADCLRHPTYCFTALNEVCQIDYDHKGHVHSRCELDRNACLDHARHNPPECGTGLTAHGHDHCVYCCDSIECFHTAVGSVLVTPPSFVLGPNGEINCHICQDAHHPDDCTRHPTYCDLARNEICQVEYDPRGHVHSRCEKDKHHCLDHERHNHAACYGGIAGHHEHCTYCCETVECFHTSVGNLLIG